MPTSPGAGPALQILLVEDNPLDAELIQYHLKDNLLAHAAYRQVDNKEDFIRALDQPPDIILSDYQLLNFTGLDALQLMQVRQLDIPFILISGTIGEDIAVDAMRGGASDYLLKDRLGRLASAIVRAVEEKKMRVSARRAEEDLRQSELKYRSLFEHVPDAAYLCDATSGRIIDTNRSGEELAGRERSALLGSRFSRMISPQEWIDLLALAENPAPAAATLELALDRTGNGAERLRLEARATVIVLYGRRLLLAFLRELVAAGPAR